MFEGINPATLGAVRALARELRYASLPSVVGRRVRIESVAGIDQTLRAAVPALGTSARLANDEQQMGLTLSKYGILDLSYVVASITARPLGYAGLRELGLLDREVTEDMIGWDGELVRWVDECRRDQPLLRIFLEGMRPREVVPEWSKRGGYLGRLLDEYLPQELTVVDACETSGQFVWLLKHFYL